MHINYSNHILQVPTTASVDEASPLSEMRRCRSQSPKNQKTSKRTSTSLNEILSSQQILHSSFEKRSKERKKQSTDQAQASNRSRNYKVKLTSKPANVSETMTHMKRMPLPTRVNQTMLGSAYATQTQFDNLRS